MTAAPSIKEALIDLISLCERKLYPQPDKPNSDWARVQAAKAALATFQPDGERREAIARETEPTVKGEMQRIRGLFSVTMDDKEDLISYAKEIVGLRGLASGLVQDEAATGSGEVLRRAIDTAYCHAMTVPCFPDHKTVDRIMNHAIAGKPAEAILEKPIRSARDGGAET